MLRDISTRRKLFLLCSAFVIAIVVAIYISVAEKRIAIDFARKELGGVEDIEQFRDIYAALLRDPLSRTSPPAFPATTITSGADAKSASQDSLRTAALEDSLKRTLSRLWSGQVTGDAQRSVAAEALTKTERVISRIGDDSGLALDPQLDSYHLQDILVRQMPKLLSQLGDVWSLASSSQPGGDAGRQNAPPYARRDRPDDVGGACTELDVLLSGQCQRGIATWHRGDDGRDAVERDRLSRRCG